MPKRSWTFTWHLGLLDQSLVFLLRGSKQKTFTGYFFREMGPTRDTFPKKMSSKYSVYYFCVHRHSNFRQEKLTKMEKIGFQIIFLEINHLQSAMKTLGPWSFLDLDELISEFQRGLVLHTSWNLYPGLPNSWWRCLKGVFGVQIPLHQVFGRLEVCPRMEIPFQRA